MPPANPPTSAGIDDRERLKRLLQFSKGLSAAMRDEFGSRERGRSCPNGDFTRLHDRLEALDLVAQRAAAALDGLTLSLGATTPMIVTVRAQLVDATQGIQAIAKALRADPATATWLATRLGAGTPEPATGRALSGMLTRWLAKLEPTPTTTEEPHIPTPAEVAAERRWEGFLTTLKVVRGILEFVGPRLTLVQVAARALGLPGKPRPWPVVVHALAPEREGAVIPPGQYEWLVPLAQVLLNNALAARDAQVAVTQLQQAEQRIEEANGTVAAVDRAKPGPPRAALVREADAGPLRAAALPLNHLHLTFRGVPLLSTLFPNPPPPPG